MAGVHDHRCVSERALDELLLLPRTTLADMPECRTSDHGGGMSGFGEGTCSGECAQRKSGLRDGPLEQAQVVMSKKSHLQSFAVTRLDGAGVRRKHQRPLSGNCSRTREERFLGPGRQARRAERGTSHSAVPRRSSC